MKECWINVYKFPSGRTWQGSYAMSLNLNAMFQDQAIANGCKLLYRIHVRMK